MKNMVKLKELAKSRIEEFIETKNSWYNGSKTYIDGIDEEWQEAKDEIKKIILYI